MMKLLISITHIQIIFFIFSCTTTKTVENPSVLSEEPIQTVTVPKWSAYQGFFGFTDAKKKCKSIGMRLPTIEELKSANRSKITKSWDKDSSYYWSSTPAGQDKYYYLYTYTGHGYPSTPSTVKRIYDVYGVRCIQ